MSASSSSVRVAERVDRYVVPNGPMEVDLRTVKSALSSLGGGLIGFPDGGATEPWTLPYEEMIYVIGGSWTFHVQGEGSIQAAEGDVVLLAEGSTVVYEGTPGARAFFALTPADWHKRADH